MPFHTRTSLQQVLTHRWRREAHRLRLWRTRRYQHRLSIRNWYDPTARCEDAAIFIGGCGRSGTTLFREVLNRHSQVFCGPETSMFGLPFNPENLIEPWSLNRAETISQVEDACNLIAFAERFYRSQAALNNKARWADKTPNNVRAISKILTWFPNAVFIHLIRDGRDVVCSLRNHPKERIVGGKIQPVVTNRPIVECATRWLDDTMKGLAFNTHPRYYEVRYEDLVGDFEGTIRSVCSVIGVDFESSMLIASGNQENSKPGRLVNNKRATAPISATSVGRWRKDLTSDEMQGFINIAGELLIALGYDSNHDWADSAIQSRPQQDQLEVR